MIYSNAINRYLVYTNAFVGFVSFVVGDYIEQKVFEQVEKIDFRRMIGFGGYGAAYGVYGYNRYRIFNKSPLFSKFPNRQALFNQLVLCPFEYLIFFVYMGCVEGQTKGEIKDEIKEKAFLTYLSDCIFYYPFLYCNSKYTPIRYRMILDSLFGFGWCIFLSFVKHNRIYDKIMSLQQYYSNRLKNCDISIDAHDDNY